jgi:exonuclease III
VNVVRPDLVCLQETKKEAISWRMAMSMLGADCDDFVVLPAAGTRGGIIVAWKGSVCKAIDSRMDRFSVPVCFEMVDAPAWWFTGVYGPQLDHQKIEFLQELRNVCSECPGPWALGGDFNLIYQAEDKNNSNLNSALMGRFRRFLDELDLKRRFLDELDLKEVALHGRKFTWSNERDAPILVRLDRVFVTLDWEQLFPEYLLQSSASEISYHCLLLLSLHDFNCGKRCFHFESFWPRL